MANIGKTPAPERPKYHSLRGIAEPPRRARAQPESLLPTSKVPRAKNAAKEVALASKANKAMINNTSRQVASKKRSTGQELRSKITSRPVACVTRSTVQEMRNSQISSVSDQKKVLRSTSKSSYSFRNKKMTPRRVNSHAVKTPRPPDLPPDSPGPKTRSKTSMVSTPTSKIHPSAFEKSRAPRKEKGSTRPLN